MLAFSNVVEDAATAAIGRASDGTLRFPCSQAQQRFWFEERLHPRNPGLNVAVRWRLEGDVSTANLEEAWRRIIARHQPLRTCFEVVGGEPVQVVEPSVPFTIPVVDLSTLGEVQAFEEAERLAQSEARRPFDIAEAPLLRVTRLRVRPSVSMLLVTAHHTVCDGWSIGILAREMGQICAALEAETAPALPDLPICYGEYAEAERSWLARANLEPEYEYARNLLAEYQQFELLPDHPRPSEQTAHGDIASVLLDKQLTDAVTEFSKQQGCTFFMTAFAALLALLHRYSGETDITLGTQVAGRDHVETENLVGCFINTVALRCKLADDPTLLQLLDRARDAVMETFEMRHVPLEKLIEIVNPRRDLSRNALFSVNFIFQRSFIQNQTYGSFALVDLPSRSAGAIYDLNFFMVERPEGWRASCEFNSDLFEANTVKTLLRRLEVLFRAIAGNPNQRVSELPLLGAEEREELVVRYNATQTDYPKNATLPQLFEAQAARTPERTAVTCDGHSMTYRELEAAANRLARELRRLGAAPGGRIGVFLERSLQIPVALLAVHKAGSAYIPLDPVYPHARLTAIAKNARLNLIITQSSLRSHLSKIEVPVVLVDTDASRIAGHCDHRLGPIAGAEDLAYIIYTSGSTGEPKGVQIQHRALTNLLCAMRERPGLKADDTLVAVTTISFDIAALEIFLPLIVGAKLVIANQAQTTDGGALLDLLQRSGATVMQSTPVGWRLLMEAGWSGVPRLVMLCGGEALKAGLAAQLLRRGTELWNMYGPTETTIWSSATRVWDAAAPIRIGRPIANTQFYVLGPHRELVPPGAPGELFIGGDGVALGYVDLPALTEQRFVPDPFRNGEGGKLYRTGDRVRMRADGLEFLGRNDGQIKLRGFRIELGEIESALLRDPDIAAAMAAVVRDGEEEEGIRAYVVLQQPPPQTSERWLDRLRARIAASLPKYMVPSSFVVVEALPKTPNGKLDRNAVVTAPVREPERRNSTALTPTESALCGAVGELLRRDRVEPGDDMFALGMHSLLAVRLVARIKSVLGVELPLRALFDHPTVAGLAAGIDAMSGHSPDGVPAIVTLNAGGPRTPLAFVHSDLFADGLYCRRLAAAIGPQQPMHALASHGTASLPVLFTIEDMARDYLARLRAVQPHGPYRVGGFCVGGLVAFELARLLRAQGEEVDRVILINASVLPSRRIPLFDWLIRTVGLNARLQSRHRERFCHNVSRLHGALLSRPAVLGRLARSWYRTALGRERFEAPLPDAQPPTFTKRRGEPATENSFAHLTAALTYHPRPYDRDVTLVWGTNQESIMGDSSHGWAAVARRVIVRPMRGDHVAPLHDRIEDLAAEMESLLR